MKLLAKYEPSVSVQGGNAPANAIFTVTSCWFAERHRPASHQSLHHNGQAFAVHGAKLIGTATLVMAVVLAVGACSTTDPTPSSRYDGRYAGTRQSDRIEACGITRPHGTTSARINRGHIDMDLFSPKTQLTGTVGEDGTVRASGLWTNPTGGFPGMTILNGKISDNELTGTASDFRCHTDVRLHRVPPPRSRSAGGRKTRQQQPE